MENLPIINRKPFGIIYRATNKVNGKSYAGLTKQSINKPICDCWGLLERRKGSHAQDSKKKNHHFAKALRKYGVDGFNWSVVEEIFTDLKELNVREKYWIAYLRLREKSFGYNMMEGGDSYGWSDEMREAQSIRVKEAFASGERVSWLKGMKGKCPQLKGRGHRPVRCIDTGVIYPSIKAAAREANTNVMSIKHSTRFIRETPKREGVPDWEFVDGPPKQHRIICKTSPYRRIKCVETGALYKTVKQASQATGVGKGMIQRVCQGFVKNPSKFHWEYVEVDTPQKRPEAKP